MPKILIIDDDQFIADMYLLKFKEEGFEVEMEKDGRAGLEKIRSSKPDVVLLDVLLPTMDGFEVLASLKKEPVEPRPKVVLLTNLGQKEDVEKGMALGADDYAVKAHFTPSEIAEKVKKLLGT